MKVLISAFEQFNNEEINSSLETLNALANNDEYELYKICLPVVFNLASKKLIEKIEKINPDVVISLGEAFGRKAISVEKIAINYQDARINDNADQRPTNQKCIADGENAYFSLLPVEEIIEEISNQGVACYKSLSAGSYVCNDLMYQILHYIKDRQKNILYGFIHIPALKRQIKENNATPFIELDEAIKAIEIAINVSIKKA